MSRSTLRLVIPRLHKDCQWSASTQQVRRVAPRSGTRSPGLSDEQLAGVLVGRGPPAAWPWLARGNETAVHMTMGCFPLILLGGRTVTAVNALLVH